MSKTPSETERGVGVVRDVIKIQADLMARILDGQRHILANQKSGATDRLDAQVLRSAEQDRRLDSMERSLSELVLRVTTLDRLVHDIYEWSMPLSERMKRDHELHERMSDGDR